MKVFVSGRIDDLENIRTIQNKLVDAGHEITHDWTQNETGNKMLASREEKLANVAETGRRAKLDIDGVINADAYIISTNNETVGKGMYTELGAALALHETTGKPNVFLVGNMNHMTVFYLHPAVQRFENIDQVIEALADSSRL